MTMIRIFYQSLLTAMFTIVAGLPILRQDVRRAMAGAQRNDDYDEAAEQKE
ncbi:MAG TPA: hypothetical protein VJV04_15485 [Nitrospiraceae bacterium]|nr:hypothetical protein [Nitrospiraceae bacterium]